DPPSLRADAVAGPLRCTRRVPPRCDRAEPQDACEPYLATTAGRDVRGHRVSLSCSRSSSCHPLREGWPMRRKLPPKDPDRRHSARIADFINAIGQRWFSGDVRLTSVLAPTTDLWRTF